MTTFGKLLLAAAVTVLAAGDAGASKIELRKRTVHPPEMSPVTVIEVMHAGSRYWIPQPRRWEWRADADTGVITLASENKQSTLVVRFTDEDASAVLASSDKLREAAAPQLGNPVLLEESAVYSDGGEAKTVVFGYGLDMRCRISVIRLGTGYVTFALHTPLSQASLGQRVLTGFVATFRSISDAELVERQAQEQRYKRLQPLNPPPPTKLEGLEAFDLSPQVPVIPPPAVPPTWFEVQRDRICLFLSIGLLAMLTHSVIQRHKREAEIRALSGGYLSDGTEVANFKMPDWFAPPPPPPTPAPEEEVPVLAETSSREEAPLPDPVTEFLFEYAPESLASIRSTLKDLAGVEEQSSRQKVLLELLHDHVTGLSKQANRWELRPVWQLSSALELLIKRISDKPKDATASALRTITAACDLLHELCVPGIRPGLAMEPPPRILAVDDEILCLRALAFALQKANIAPDVAQDGKRAVELAVQKPYDVIFLDINMPEMDGLAACTNIRQSSMNEDTPIVFVTGLSDFSMRARTIAIGGTDFMAKPFLVFELTVKAMTLLMRKRLDIAKGRRPAPVLPPNGNTTPSIVPLVQEKPEPEPSAIAV